MNRSFMRRILVVSWLLSVSGLVGAQTRNLLQNPSGDDGTNHWRVYGNASVERRSGGNWEFVVRNKGSFAQDVDVPEEAAGLFVLLIGRVSSERINPDGAITGLPYLYGYSMSGAGRILAYLQGQEMLCTSRKQNERVTAWGLFQVVSGTTSIRFFLNQAERKDVPQNGSAARFDDVGLYLFATENDARAFVTAYTAEHR